MAPRIEPHAVVLFQGDSITDAGRSRTEDWDLGVGYAAISAAWFSARYPERHVQFLNRGISGNRAQDLVGRWDVDALGLKPTWISIMIGINDTWRRYDSNQITTTEAYEASYREILQRTQKEGDIKLILLSPFVLPVPEDRRRWREDLDPKIAVVERLAREFEAIYVPLDQIFAEAATRREAAFWAADGVHPSPAGHALIAQAWLEAVEQ